MVFNGNGHFRVHVHAAIPSYLWFGKFLIRPSHNGQQQTCRKCNRFGHFANECPNTICFNCEELGHVAETCPNAKLCCICKEPSHRAWFCHFSWYCDVSPASSPAPQCHDTRQDTHQDTSRDMPVVANPPDPPPSSVAPSDRQPPLPVRTPRTFLTPKVFSLSVICLVMMTSPVFFQIVKLTLLMMIARIIMLMITMMRMMMLMVMIITTMKIMMMITMVMIWSLPKPVYRSLPLLALTQLLSVGPSLPLPTLLLPPPR